MPLTVRGLRDLQVLFAKASKEASKDLKAELRSVAEPIRADAQALATSRITRVGPKWSRMRTGVTRNAVYVAPTQRGVHGRSSRRARPKFATLMEARAMGPAQAHGEALIEARVEAVFERLARKWNG